MASAASGCAAATSSNEATAFAVAARLTSTSSARASTSAVVALSPATSRSSARRSRPSTTGFAGWRPYASSLVAMTQSAPCTPSAS